jgi:predicted transcriptional regulator
MEKVFGGSPTALVQTLVQREDLSDEDRRELKALIHQMAEDDDRSDS